MQSIDKELLFFIYNHTIPGSIPVLQFVSNITTFVSVALLLILLFLAIKQKSIFFRNCFVSMTLVLLLASLTTTTVKSLTGKERPFNVHPEIIKKSKGGESSFPSGHTLEAFAMAMGMLQLFRQKRKLVVGLFVWASLVGYSRIALGVHYPSDVLAGIIFGLLLGWFIPQTVQRVFLRVTP